MTTNDESMHGEIEHEETRAYKKKYFSVPHVYVLLLIIIFICGVLSYIIPAGVYDMTTVEISGVEREVINPETFKYIDKTPVSLMEFLSSVPRGMQEAAQSIFFLFIAGGSFAVVQATGAIEAGLGILTGRTRGREHLIIPIVMVIFGLCGSLAGIAEETLPFIPIFVSLFIALGYDSITGVAVILCGSGAGIAGAFLNPFTVGVAQEIAGLPAFSGILFRIVLFAIMMAVTVWYVMRYANKVKKKPEISSMLEIDRERKNKLKFDNIHEFGIREKVIIAVFVGSIFLLIFGVLEWGWYMDEIAALFFGMGIVSGIIGKLSFNEFANSLGTGMANVAAGALVVGFSQGILVILTDGNILHTILHYAASELNEVSASFPVLGQYIFQSFLNFLVPSGPGQAAISIPILSSYGDMLGVTRQTTCVVFQLGDGISNIFMPTSGYFVAGLSLARIPWGKWIRWVFPMIFVQYLVGAVAVIVAQCIELGPF